MPAGRWTAESLAAAAARELADDARRAKAAARRAQRVQAEAWKALDRALDSLVLEHCHHHRRVVCARERLDRKRRDRPRPWRLVRNAKRALAAAVSSLKRRRLAVRVVSEELAASLDNFAEAAVRSGVCDFRYADLKARAQRADAALAPRDRLLSLISRQDNRCGICGEPLPRSADDIHIDHIRPRSRGGTDDAWNLQATHAHCNIKKGATWPWPDEKAPNPPEALDSDALLEETRRSAQG